MGTFGDTGIYIPDIGEPVPTWPPLMNAGLGAHDSFDYHIDPSKFAPDQWFDPDDGVPGAGGERQDNPKLHPQECIDKLGSRGGVIKQVTTRVATRGVDAPHLDLGSTPLVVTGQKYVTLILGNAAFAGHGGDATGGTAQCWITGAVANGGLLQVHNGVEGFQLFGGGFENTASGGIGVELYDKYARHRLQEVSAINCERAGFEARGSTGDDSTWYGLVSTGCGFGYSLCSDVDLELSLPNAIKIIGGQAERSTKRGISVEGIHGFEGGRGILVMGTKVQKASTIDGTDSNQGGIVLLGPSSFVGLGLYNEWIIDSDGALPDIPLVRIRAQTSAVNEADWTGMAMFLGGEWTNGGDISGWSSGGGPGSVGLGRTFDVNQCLGFYARVRIAGGGMTSHTHPVCYFHGSTERGYFDGARTVGQYSSPVTDPAALYGDDTLSGGVYKNYGEYFDGTRHRTLGTAPWS